MNTKSIHQTDEIKVISAEYFYVYICIKKRSGIVDLLRKETSCSAFTAQTQKEID